MIIIKRDIYIRGGTWSDDGGESQVDNEYLYYTRLRGDSLGVRICRRDI